MGLNQLIKELSRMKRIEISLTEAFACSVRDKFRISRKKAVTIICIIGIFGSVIFTTRAGLYILDIVDHFINNYALIIGGIAECVLVGWLLKASRMRKHVNSCGGLRLWTVWDLTIKFVTPAMLAIIVGSAVIQEFSECYEGYPIKALVLIGGGVLIGSRLISFVLSHFPWIPEKLLHEHAPEDETLLT